MLGFCECFGRMRKRTQTTQTLPSQALRSCSWLEPSALALRSRSSSLSPDGELLPQPRLSVAW